MMVKATKNKVGPFDRYVSAIVRSVAPKGTSMSRVARATLSSMVMDLHGRYEAEIPGIFKTSHVKQTLKAQDVQTATRLLFRGELAKHAVNEGTKYVTIAMHGAEKAEDKAKAAKLAKEMKAEGLKPHKSTKLIFRPARVARLLRRHRVTPRMSKFAPVYLAAVYEYVVGEVAELAVAQLGKRKRITSRNIKMAVTEDSELRPLFRGTIPQGGVEPTLARYEAKMKEQNAKTSK